MKAKIRVIQPQVRNTSSHQKLKGVTKDSHLEPWEGLWPCLQLPFRLLAARTEREHASVVLNDLHLG